MIMFNLGHNNYTVIEKDDDASRNWWSRDTSPWSGKRVNSAILGRAERRDLSRRDDRKLDAKWS